MSQDWLIRPERSDAVPRVARDNVGSFMGRRRVASRPDEEGAELVVDLIFGGRVLLYPLDKDFFRVRHLYAHEERA